MSHPAGFPPPAGPPVARPRHPQATTILVLGVVGIVFLPLVASIPAWIMGGRARRDLRADPSLDGSAEITVGWVLGIASTAITVLALLFIAFVFLIVGGVLFGVDQAVQDLPTTTP